MGDADRHGVSTQTGDLPSLHLRCAFLSSNKGLNALTGFQVTGDDADE